MKSQVTTKRGDAGQTSTLSGERCSKGHLIMDCVGGVDELRAHTALVRLLVIEQRPHDYEALAGFLYWLAHVYFLVGTECSDPLVKRPQYHHGAVSGEHVERLEREQMRLEATVKLPRAFVVSASNALSAQVDVTCTVARRLERDLVRLADATPDWAAAEVLRFVNRLNDYLFILARYLEDGKHLVLDYDTLEEQD